MVVLMFYFNNDTAFVMPGFGRNEGVEKVTVMKKKQTSQKI